MGPTTSGWASAYSIFLAHCSIVKKPGLSPLGMAASFISNNLSPPKDHAGDLCRCIVHM